MEGTSDEVKVAAAGNFLFNREGSSFEQVAGLDSESHVAKVGWSIGGQSRTSTTMEKLRFVKTWTRGPG